MTITLFITSITRPTGFILGTSPTLWTCTSFSFCIKKLPPNLPIIIAIISNIGHFFNPKERKVPYISYLLYFAINSKSLVLSSSAGKPFSAAAFTACAWRGWRRSSHFFFSSGANVIIFNPCSFWLHSKVINNTIFYLLICICTFLRIIAHILVDNLWIILQIVTTVLWTVVLSCLNKQKTVCPNLIDQLDKRILSLIIPS